MASSPISTADILASMTTDAQGDVVLHLSPNHDITLHGIHTQQVNAGWFMMTH
jgi:hypothetical protein